MQNPATLSGPISTAMRTTEHSADTEWGLALELTFHIMNRDDIDFVDALSQLEKEIHEIAFHSRVSEMEGYDPESIMLLDFDVDTWKRYNRAITVDGAEYKFPSATAATLFRNHWAVCPDENVAEVCVDDFGKGFQETLNGVLRCLTVNNGYGRSNYGGYLKYRFDWNFAGNARLASFFKDGREKEERFAYWHRRYIEVARVGLMAIAKGIVFPKQSPYDRKQDREGGFTSYLEDFRESFPDIAETFSIGKGVATRIESLFTLPGHLLALFAIGETERVREEYTFWLEAFDLAEKVLERRKELVSEVIVELQPNHTVFGLDFVPGAALGLYIETDEHVGKELWDFLKRPVDSKEATPLQETFHHMFLVCMRDHIGDIEFTNDEKRKRADMAMLSLGQKDREKSLLAYVEQHIEDVDIMKSLQRLVVLSNCQPAVFFMRKPDGHGTVLTNRGLGMKIDLRKAAHNLNAMEKKLADEKGIEPCVWHIEGMEATGRFSNHMLMTGGSGKIVDRPPSLLTPAQIKKTLRLTVGVIH